MQNQYLKQIMLLLAVAVLSAGCISSITTNQGKTAYLEKDYPTAKMKFEEAIVDGNADAMYHLANMYASGKGVPQDYAKAAELLEQAVLQEHVESQLMLGLFYVYGDGVPQDPAKGVNLVKLAAVNGNDTAMYYLGIFYATGLGVTKDIPTALHWMNQAKTAGFPVSSELLTEAGLKALN